MKIERVTLLFFTARGGVMIPAMNKWLVKLGLKKAGEEARKTVTFGDPQAARGGLFWSILSAALIVAVWGDLRLLCGGASGEGGAHADYFHAAAVGGVVAFYLGADRRLSQLHLIGAYRGERVSFAGRLCAGLSGGGADWLCDGLVADVERPVSSGGGIYAADSAAGFNSVGDYLFGYRRQVQDCAVVFGGAVGDGAVGAVGGAGDSFVQKFMRPTHWARPKNRCFGG